MNCWQILKLEKGSDQKAIKIAYAKLLKITKPDDDPQGFKSLHAAYKEALASLVKIDEENSSPQWFTPPEQKHTPPLLHDAPDNHEEDNNEEAITPSHHLTSHDREIGLEVNTEIEARNRQQQLHNDWANLITQVESLLKVKPKDSSIADWEFIAEIPSMLDLEFHSQASEHIFRMISDANVHSLKKGILWVKAPILDYLNLLFHWEDKWREYKKLFDSQITAIYPYLFLTKKDTKKIVARKREKQSDYDTQRLMAFIVDTSPVFLFIWINFSHKDKMFLLLPVAAAIYGLIIMPLMEASRYQASLGKLLFSLKVVDINEQRITVQQSFGRILATLICIIGFVPIVVLIDLYLYFVQKENNFLQDIMSKTYVIDK